MSTVTAAVADGGGGEGWDEEAAMLPLAIAWVSSSCSLRLSAWALAAWSSASFSLAAFFFFFFSFLWESLLDESEEELRRPNFFL